MSWINTTFDENSPDLGSSMDDSSIFSQSINASLACRSSLPINSQPLFGPPMSSTKDLLSPAGNGAAIASRCSSVLDLTHHQMAGSLLGSPSSSDIAVHNGSSHSLTSSSALFPLAFLERGPNQPTKSSSSVLLAPSDVGPLSDEEDPDLVTTSCPIPDLDNMTANELCEDIAYTHHSLGLMANTPGHLNGLDEPPQLVSPPQSVTHSLGDSSSNFPSPPEVPVASTAVSLQASASSPVSSIVTITASSHYDSHKLFQTQNKSDHISQPRIAPSVADDSLNTSIISSSSNLFPSSNMLNQSSEATPETPAITFLSDGNQSLRLSLSPSQITSFVSEESPLPNTSQMNHSSSLFNNSKYDSLNISASLSLTEPDTTALLPVKDTVSESDDNTASKVNKSSSSGSSSNTAHVTTAPTHDGGGGDGNAGDDGGSGDGGGKGKEVAPEDKEEDTTSHEASSSSNSSQESTSRHSRNAANVPSPAADGDIAASAPRTSITVPRTSLVKSDSGDSQNSNLSPPVVAPQSTHISDLTSDTATEIPVTSVIITSHDCTSFDSSILAAATSSTAKTHSMDITAVASISTPSHSEQYPSVTHPISIGSASKPTLPVRTMVTKAAVKATVPLPSQLACMVPASKQRCAPQATSSLTTNISLSSPKMSKQLSHESQDLFDSEDLAQEAADSLDDDDDDDVVEASPTELQARSSRPLSTNSPLSAEGHWRKSSRVFNISSNSSSSSVDPDSNSSSDAKVLVDYHKLKKNKDFEISPTIERRRKGISEAYMESTANRKISFPPDLPSSSSQHTTAVGRPSPAPAPTGNTEADCTVPQSLDQSLEVIYDAKRDSVYRLPPLADDGATSSVVESQDLQLLLPTDSQSQASSVLPSGSTEAFCTSAGGVASSCVVRNASSEELSHLPSAQKSMCRNTLSSSSGSCLVQDSQVPVGTINPTQLELLLSESERPRLSQSPEVGLLLSNPIQQELKSNSTGVESMSTSLTSSKDQRSTKNKDFSVTESSILSYNKKVNFSAEIHDSSLGEESQSNIHPSIEIIETVTPKFKSPARSKNQCHQSLLLDSAPSQPSSSDSSSSSSHSNGTLDPSETPEIGVEARSSARASSPSNSLPETDSSPEERIKLPEISSYNSETLSTFQCSGSIIAKATQAAKQSVIEAEQKSKEDRLAHSPRKRVCLEQASSSMSLDLSPYVPVSETPTNKSYNQEGIILKSLQKDNPTKSSSSDSSGLIESISGRDVRRTSTPNQSRIIAGISPSISEEGGSYIEKDLPVNSSVEEIGKSGEGAVAVESAEEGLGRTISSKSTVELLHEDVSKTDSFKSIEELRSNDFILEEVLELKVWRNRCDNSLFYTSENGNEELFSRTLPFRPKLAKSSSSSSSDKRMSDVSTITSSSSGYHADKSSSSSTGSRRMSSLTQADSVLPRSRLSVESVQIVPYENEPPFALPSSRPLKSKSPRVPALIAEETSSSDERDTAVTQRTLGYGHFKAGKSSKLPIIRVKSTIPEHPEGIIETDHSITEVVDLTGSDPPARREERQVIEKPTELKSLSKTGIVNKGLHYDLDKFFGDLPDSAVDVLRSVQMSEEEEEIFVGGCDNQISMLDRHEEQARMVISKMIAVTLAPNILVFAKYHDHYYSAIIESEHPSGGWNIRFTLDGFQKHCPIEHILPIDILPRGQHCFRRYQGPSNSKSIVSVDVIITGHTVQDNIVLHIAEDAQQAFQVPHSHLSMNVSDAERFVNAWKVTQSIVSTGPDVSLNNIVCGKRRRAPAPGSPGSLKSETTSGASYSPAKARSVRKKRKQNSDPNFDTSLTETDATLPGGDDRADVTDVDASDDSKRPAKRRSLDEHEQATSAATPAREATPVRSKMHPRIREILSEDISEDDPSDDEPYTVTPKSSRKKSVPKKLSLSSPKKKSRTVKRLMVSLTVDPSLQSTIDDQSGAEVAPEVLERLASDGEPEEASLAEPDHPLKRGRKCKRKGTSPSLDPAPDRDSNPASTAPLQLQAQTPRKRGRPPGVAGSDSRTPSKQAKLETTSTPQRKDEDDSHSKGPAKPENVTKFARRGRTRSCSSDTADEAEVLTAASSSRAVESIRSSARSPVAATAVGPAGDRTAKTRQSRKDRRTGLRSRLDTIDEGEASVVPPFREERLLDPGTDPRLGTIPPKGSLIFQGYTVLITDSGASKSRCFNQESDDEDDIPPLNRRHLTEQIRAGGGVVISKFEEADLIRVRQATFSGGGRESQEGGRLLLLCDKPCRTTKYIQCLLVGIPIVSHRWVITASDMNQRRDWENFLLPAGVDVVTGAMVEQSPGVVKHTPGDAVTASLGRVLDRKTTIVLADASIPKPELDRARQLGKPVVSSAWFIQSVIFGYKLPCDFHSSFKHDAQPEVAALDN
ncbi:mucin-17 [Hyalella azteca]|uniref:Mucin-17 n=1 Tax=Hyalella azteca TaxID=294128 RepID=A0A8B7MY10_HYAAZ|nr:mucin-17 [Hyalella azteca]